ncbi:MAG: DegT/DnrJ/EryC1/StrS family aminotransferase [Coriobacteriia bacterium]|nr:DegT/DnrJ/EryC1/StrS family aminotransferase [Coriobacteriia bacterium]
MRVPFVDLKMQAKTLGDEYGAVLHGIVDRAAYTLGPEVAEFERAFAEFCNADHCIGVSSGTDALKLAYLAVGVGPGDEVIVPANTFIATAEAVSHIGAVPVFVDCLQDTANMDPAKIEAAITTRTRAIVPVHLYGQVAAMREILEVGQRHNVPVVEDACQAHGAEYNGRRAGSLGAVSAFSFYPGKNLGALGDGGAVVTHDPDIADRVRLLRNHGQSDKYTHAVVGYCDRLHNLQAAFLNCKLPLLDDWNESRRASAARYHDLLSGADGIRMITTAAGCLPVFHLFVVEIDDRDRVRDALSAAGIESGIHYPVPLHLTPAYNHRGYSAGDFPNAERLAGRILSLPMYPGMSDEQVEYVVQHLMAAVRG